MEDALWNGLPQCDYWPAATTVITISSSDGEDDYDAAAVELLRRGPWTADEDALLARHVSAHGEGRWNELALAAGLRRTGKSCRLRWLNYLRPGVRRGDFTPREQLLILDLHARWGNRWSKIAAHLPAGRTDNEVKNYWRTRVQKHAKQMGCDVGSRRFHDAVRNLWMPRLVERIHADDSAAAAAAAVVAADPVGNGGSCKRAPSSPEDASCVTAAGSALLWSREASPASHQLFQQSSSGCSITMAAAGCSTTSTAEQCQNGRCSASSATSCGFDDMLDESWSELLARANNSDTDSAGGLTEFGFGETGDNWWSLEDIWEQPLY